MKKTKYFITVNNERIEMLSFESFENAKEWLHYLMYELKSAANYGKCETILRYQFSKNQESIAIYTKENEDATYASKYADLDKSMLSSPSYVQIANMIDENDKLYNVAIERSEITLYALEYNGDRISGWVEDYNKLLKIKNFLEESMQGDDDCGYFDIDIVEDDE